MAEEAVGRTLRDVAIGDEATVRRLVGSGPIKRHIMDMGITKGAVVRVRKVAPLGDPLEVTVRGYELSLRKSEAECVLVD
ncbi:ferrous iron transport protein A [Eggerthellaceae bacterium zg-1084]|uniref:Ferrous iron transport protein A n=1 Tax=Berryella wangjianweii TaxID=2734634 RepID=A0A6M8J426_9ACTN|nr:FeoA family protein [Berryella wangjianweii]NPD30714.1 ferrous iron transport protein A [Berryella wangjianweii]NPD32067.1 ferrous iron transport protein A [Eggerthellaceae bacterium zg-997]QKF07353.1 ferrous iron transport protein A [Berryella wangjianweii]